MQSDARMLSSTGVGTVLARAGLKREKVNLEFTHTLFILSFPVDLISQTKSEPTFRITTRNGHRVSQDKRLEVWLVGDLYIPNKVKGVREYCR